MKIAIILLSGAVIGAEVVTEDVKPFTRWAILLRRMRLSVRVREMRRENYLD